MTARGAAVLESGETLIDTGTTYASAHGSLAQALASTGSYLTRCARETYGLRVTDAGTLHGLRRWDVTVREEGRPGAVWLRAVLEEVRP